MPVLASYFTATAFVLHLWTDNGREIVIIENKKLAETLYFTLKTTAAECPFSNGVERQSNSHGNAHEADDQS